MLKSFVRFSTFVAAVGVLGAGLAARQAPGGDAEAAKLKNPVASSPESIAAGKKAYGINCAGCHGNNAEGAEKAGIVISVIEDTGGKQPPDLTDAKWDNGSTDGEIFTAIKKGVPPTLMAPWEGRIADNDIWNIVNFLRSIEKK